MCGIVGYLGSRDSITFVLSGLILLQNRGYDSAGISCIMNDKIKTRKFASTNTNDSLEKLAQSSKELVSNISIGHTRWATHGGKTDINSHPHSDNKCRISLVHNGIIENYYEIKENLIKSGYFFYSETDTEVIAVLIGKHLDDGLTIYESIKKTISLLSGTWALIIIHHSFPNKIWTTRNGSPLLLGIEDEYIMIVSEKIAFGNNINKYIIIDNHDIIEIVKEKKISFNTNILDSPVKNTNNSLIEELDSKYPHWMIKEITEQPECILRAINNGGRINSNIVTLGGLDANCEEIMLSDHLIILGCGTSFNAGLWSSNIFKSLDIFDTVTIYDGADFDQNDIPKKGKTVIILLSQSGETKDLCRCIQIAKSNNIFTIGCVNVVDSLISREVYCGVYLNAGREVSVPSTKTFTNQCIVLSLIAVWFSQNKGTCLVKRNQIIHDIHNLYIQMSSVIERFTGKIKNIVSNISHDSIFILGKGMSYSIALEGALKIKETSYIHADGYSASSLKHGTFALIKKNTPIILLDLDSNYYDKMENTTQEVLARDAYVIRITTNKDSLGLNETLFLVDDNKTYSSLLANCILQLFSYYLSISLKINPDFPRNLAKVVTVE